jgi:plastocyanin
MRIGWWTAAMAIVMFAGGGAAQAAAPRPATETRVAIKQFKFQPAHVRVAAGGTVTWENDDEEEHTVTAQDRSYTSAGLDANETFSHTFTTPGTYTYFCALHPHMTATVVVR